MPRIVMATPEDLPKILDLFRESVIQSGVEHYTSAQLAAWSSSADNLPRWQQKVQEDQFLLALEGTQLQGFASLKSPDYLDLMYVAPTSQRLGVASSLLAAIEDRAKKHGITVLKSDVSRVARPFFEHKGFCIVKAQQVERKGEWLENFRMEKTLKLT
ncbi:MAG: GNAT family N-acetyltransferase [Bacteroidota bacterium]